MDRHRIERSENLRRELSRRRYDQRASLPARLIDEMMEDWEYERGSLAASGHGAGENVAPLECGWYCFSLNWSWSLKPQLFETFVEAGVKF